MGKTTFSGPLRTGKDTGNSSSTIGTVEVIQQATVVAQNSAGNPVLFTLPSGSNITDILVDVETPFAAGALVTAQRMDIRVGGTLITEIGVSASGRYSVLDAGLGTDGTDALRNVTAVVSAFASTKALASAATVGQAMLTVKYIQV